MINADEQQAVDSFQSVVRVLANDERFKIKLGIGRDAYTSLKASKLVGQLWDVGGAAGTGASVAASTTVASTFFGGFWSAIGLATAATPIGWVVGAALVSGGAYYGVARLFKPYTGSRVEEIPKFLNTGLDVLATTVLDLIGSLALKVAAIDGTIDADERSSIEEYFVEEWGYDPDYVKRALDVLLDNIERSRLSDMAAELAAFSRDNPDCNYEAIQKELRRILVEVAEADGRLDEREEMAIERIHKALDEHGSLIASASELVSSSTKQLGSFASGTAQSVQSSVRNLTGRLWPRKG